MHAKEKNDFSEICRFCGYEEIEHTPAFSPSVGYYKACPDAIGDD